MFGHVLQAFRWVQVAVFAVSVLLVILLLLYRAGVAPAFLDRLLSGIRLPGKNAGKRRE
jgi:hypothetical protein